jgi:cytochrome c-type biogenesis protein CcmE
MSTGTRLAIGGCVISAVTAYMAYLGASSSWQYYLSVDECAADALELLGRPLRVAGNVAPGSLQINANRASACFTLNGADRTLHVICAGPLPDNLTEGIDVVVEGRLESASNLRGEKVLTRCASKYRSQSARGTTERRYGSRSEDATGESRPGEDPAGVATRGGSDSESRNTGEIAR